MPMELELELLMQAIHQLDKAVVSAETCAQVRR